MKEHKEHWADIPGFEKKYQVSTFGRIKSLSKKLWNGKVWWSSKEKILHKYISGSNYEYVSLYYAPSKYKNYWVHRLVLLAFIGDSDLEVNHIDGNKKNNDIHNLEYVTSKENKAHAWKIGLYNKNTIAQGIANRAWFTFSAETRAKLSKKTTQQWIRWKEEHGAVRFHS